MLEFQNEPCLVLPGLPASEHTGVVRMRRVRVSGHCLAASLTGPDLKLSILDFRIEESATELEQQLLHATLLARRLG